MMKKVELRISFEEYNSIEELSEQDRILVKKATEAHDRAYAPYSQYYVGAALLLDNNEIISGNNQENVAYPSGLCAERVALFYASSKHPDAVVKTIAIAAKAENFVITDPVAPCGACRQVMSEYESKQTSPIRIILKAEKGKILIFEKVEDILPFMFHTKELKK
jgi:cytidine deaminase